MACSVDHIRAIINTAETKFRGLLRSASLASPFCLGTKTRANKPKQRYVTQLKSKNPSHAVNADTANMKHAYAILSRGVKKGCGAGVLDSCMKIPQLSRSLLQRNPQLTIIRDASPVAASAESAGEGRDDFNNPCGTLPAASGEAIYDQPIKEKPRALEEATEKSIREKPMSERIKEPGQNGPGLD